MESMGFNPMKNIKKLEDLQEKLIYFIREYKMLVSNKTWG